MAWLGIHWMNEHVLTRCTSIEQAYFTGAMICIKPMSYINMISFFSTKYSVVISNETSLRVTIFFGIATLYYPDAIQLSYNDLLDSEFYVIRKELVQNHLSLEIL